MIGTHILFTPDNANAGPPRKFASHTVRWLLMRRSLLGGMACLTTLFIACTPLVRTHSTPHGPKISADCLKVGGSTMVSLSIHRKEGEPSWKIQFIGDSPENLTI